MATISNECVRTEGATLRSARASVKAHVIMLSDIVGTRATTVCNRAACIRSRNDDAVFDVTDYRTDGVEHRAK